MLFSIKSENLKLASRSRDYMRKSTIENLKTCQPREQNMQLSFDKRCSFPAQNSAFSLGQTRLMSGKLSRLKSKHTRKNRHASGLNENGSNGYNANLHASRSQASRARYHHFHYYATFLFKTPLSTLQYASVNHTLYGKCVMLPQLN